MPFSNLSSSQLERLIQLIKEKETIQAKLVQVNRSMEAFEARNAPSLKPLAQKGSRRRGAIKIGLLKKLEAAGKGGLSVKDLAASLKAKPASVAIWFYTTGKKVKGIKKVGRAKYAYSPA
jgi:hypothetical protein